MKEFKKYHKIHRLGAEENEGILDGMCYIQEKIDGANTSIWLRDGKLMTGSRNMIVEGGFNGFRDYVEAHAGILKLLEEHPDWRLYGEWLVKHTINYSETAYRKFYLFDIEDENGKFMETLDVYRIASAYDIETPAMLDSIPSPTLEDIMLHVGHSELGSEGEGVVIKNPSYFNKYGEQVYAKVVTSKFKENNAIAFGGNNKYSDNYWEVWTMNKYMTLARVKKVMGKLQPLIDKKLDMEHTARIINTAYHDLMTEEIWEIQKKVPGVAFKALARVCMKKAAQIYHDILNNNTNVHDQRIEEENSDTQGDTRERENHDGKEDAA